MRSLSTSETTSFRMLNTTWEFRLFKAADRERMGKGKMPKNGQKTGKVGFLKKHANLLVILCGDILLFVLGLYIAHLLRFGMEVSSREWEMFFQVLPLVIPIKLSLFYFCDLYRGMWRYTSLADLINIIKASVSSTLVIVFLLLFINRFQGLSRSVFIIDLLLTIILVSGFRVAVRLYFEGTDKDCSPGSFWKNILKRLREQDRKNLLIIGAGDCGEKIYREIRDNDQIQYRVVGFLDDHPSKIGKKIHGIPVLGSVDQLSQVANKCRPDEILIAVPSATPQQMRDIVEQCRQSRIEFKTVPSMAELIDGKVSVRSIREVDYRDLLGREEVRLDQKKIGAYLKDQCVMVTGAGGSIGSELCRQICRYRPANLILFEQAETLLYHIDLELRQDFPQVDIVPLLADVRDMNQVDRTFARYRPQTVFHAAAYKHVPMLESQPWTPVKNNILGTANLIQASKVYCTESFVFVSTDKAVRPTNVMGATKRVAEMLVQNQNGGMCERNPRFVSVRFGNVVGSAGSVVPLFKRQIEQGGPITITHPEVTRYFMMIPEACQLILQAGGMGRGGEIFILNMGQPVRIKDMARDLIRISGFEPEVDVPLKYTGLRPGEKLCEELISKDESVVSSEHEQIMVVNGSKQELTGLEASIAALKKAATAQDEKRIRCLLKEIVPEYEG